MFKHSDCLVTVIRSYVGFSTIKSSLLVMSAWTLRLFLRLIGRHCYDPPLNSSSVSLLSWLCRYSKRPSSASSSARDTQSKRRERLNIFTTFGRSALAPSSHDVSALLRGHGEDKTWHFTQRHLEIFREISKKVQPKERGMWWMTSNTGFWCKNNFKQLTATP